MPGSYLTDLFGLSGKTAVVIGGTGVLGGAMCEALAAAGAHVVIAGRTPEKSEETQTAIEAAAGSCETYSIDATRRDELTDLVAHLNTAGRSCDVLVNAAGINAATPFLEISDDEWHRIFQVNLDSVRLSCQVFGEWLLKENRGGENTASIVNIASMSAIIPLSRVFTYSASKAAVLNLTMNLAREWATQGIRVNALSPGFFPAEQNRKVLTPERTASILGHTPMDRFGDPAELAGTLLMLASPVAGRFVTGTNAVVDGGYSAMTI